MSESCIAAMNIIRHHCFMCFVLLVCLSMKINHCYGADIKTGFNANQSLSGNQTIISEGGVFRLGFFKPGNSSNNYIGIWYEVDSKSPVWVANREIPISDIYSSELRIMNGDLVLLNESKIPIWSTNLKSKTLSDLNVVLSDNGNLVLRDGFDSNSSEILWQSFDYPTDTWLPGNKIGIDYRTKTHKRLISWKNSEDPAPGFFSLELDPNEPSRYIILWNGTEEYWTSGIWNGHIFSLVPEMRSNFLYNFSYVSNPNESYFIYSLYDPLIISKFQMDISGQIKVLRWLDRLNEWNLFWAQPRDQCEVSALCGAFGICNQESSTPCNCLHGYVPKTISDWDFGDHSGGCVRSINLHCKSGNNASNGESDKFLVSSNMKIPKNVKSFGVASSKTCEETCLNNCSCSVYAYDNKMCSIWNEDVLNLQQLGKDSGKTINIKLAASEFPNSDKKSKTVIIGLVVGSVVLVLLAIAVFYVWRRRSTGPTNVVEGSLFSFRYKDLQNATKNFSEKVGEGGFGSVFKGTLPDLTKIAVKKLESISQGEKQFRSEVSTIGTVQHVNLVRLRGFCSEGAKKLLVYDYMPNGSLSANLFQDSIILDWKTRYQIALGTARGLIYLHEKCRDCIIHCDIKPENILLDSEFCPKVADFGLAKLIGREFSRVLTTMRGTRGYLAPEWLSGVAITAKADVYSYGMLLFEIVSGKRNNEQSEDGKLNFFPTVAANKIINGENIISLLDCRLKGNADPEEVNRVCGVACWCIQDDEMHRPSMSQVVQMLEGVLDVKLPPLPRSLQIFGDNQEHIVFFTESSSNQSSQTQSNSSTDSSQIKSSTFS